ncbi:MAG: efflux RND transporter periplasmic adaptor subunit [Planctomycetota bacterium]
MTFSTNPNRLIKWLISAMVILGWAKTCHADAYGPNPIGILRPSQRSVLRVTRPGNVQAISVREGQSVSEGTPLLTLDDRLAQARLAVATSQANQQGTVRSARLAVETLQREIRLVKEAVNHQAASQFELVRKESALAQLQADWETAVARQAQLDASVALARAELQQLTLVAPYDCEVIEIHLDRGSTTGPAEDAITVAQLDRLITDVYIPVELGIKLREGTQYWLRPEHSDEDLIATMIHQSPVIHPTSRCIRCVFEIENTDRQIRAGTHVTVDLNQFAREPTSR